MIRDEPFKAPYDDNIKYQETGVRLLPGETLNLRNRYIKNNGKDPIYINDDNWRELAKDCEHSDL